MLKFELKNVATTQPKNFFLMRNMKAGSSFFANFQLKLAETKKATVAFEKKNNLI